MKTEAISKLPLPPGPRGRRFRNFRERSTDFPGFLERLHREYGKIVYHKVLNLNCCAVFDADLALKVFQSEPPLVPWYLGSAYDVLDMCLSTSQDEDHDRRRRLILSAAAKENTGYYAQAIIRSAVALRDRCRVGQTIDLKAEFDNFMWRALLDSTLGGDTAVDPDVGRDGLKTMKLDILFSITPGASFIAKLPLPLNRRVRRILATMDEHVYRAIRKARDPSHPGQDIVSHLVRGADRGVVDWSWKNDKDIRDEIVAHLVAFPDAPVVALTCGMYHLGKHPEARERLEAEVDSVLGGSVVEPSDLERLPWMRAVFKETLRITSPAYVMLPRKAYAECELGGYRIPEGTIVSVGTRQIHLGEEYWDDPNSFRPERWLRDSQPGRPGCPAHAYLPFGYEPRKCPWSGFAEMMFVYSYALLSQQIRFDVHSDEMPEMVSLGVGLKRPLPATVKERPGA